MGEDQFDGQIVRPLITLQSNSLGATLQITCQPDPLKSLLGPFSLNFLQRCRRSDQGFAQLSRFPGRLQILQSSPDQLSPGRRFHRLEFFEVSNRNKRPIESIKRDLCLWWQLRYSLIQLLDQIGPDTLAPHAGTGIDQDRQQLFVCRFVGLGHCRPPKRSRKCKCQQSERRRTK